MVDFEDLRKSAEETDSFEDEEEIVSSSGETDRSQLFLGMTPLERMFISMFMFMNVAVLGIALLLATGRIGG